MALDTNGYKAILQGLLPTGLIWPRDSEAILSRVLEGAAVELARVDGRAEDLVDEADPRATLEMLTDWERVCGLPDACAGDTPQALAQRQRALVAKVTARGGQSPAYFTALAATLGHQIQIYEHRPGSTQSSCADHCGGPDWALAWEVRAASSERGLLDCGGACADPLSWWGIASLECLIRQAAPAHTLVLFVYQQYLLTESLDQLTTEDGEPLTVPI